MDVQFVDVQIIIDSETTARAYMTVEVATPDPRDRSADLRPRDTMVRLGRRGRPWVITTVEPVETLQRP